MAKKKAKAVSADTLIKRRMKKSPALKKEWEKESPVREFAYKLIGARIKMDLSQADIAKLTGMKQQEISRIENAYEGVTVKTLSRIVESMGGKLIFNIEMPSGEKIKKICKKAGLKCGSKSGHRGRPLSEPESVQDKHVSRGHTPTA